MEFGNEGFLYDPEYRWILNLSTKRSDLVSHAFILEQEDHDGPVLLP